MSSNRTMGTIIFGLSIQEIPQSIRHAIQTAPIFRTASAPNINTSVENDDTIRRTMDDSDVLNGIRYVDVNIIDSGTLFVGDSSLSYVTTTTQQESIGNTFSDMISTIFSNIGVEILPTQTTLEDVNIPISTEAFNKLEEMEYKKYCKEHGKKVCEVCAICQETYEDTSEIKILPCEHIFHKECVQEWLQKYQHKCPLCRSDCGEHAPQL